MRDPRVAEPGDDDIDADIRDLVLTSVSVFGHRSVVLGFTGGVGFFDDDGVTVELESDDASGAGLVGAAHLRADFDDVGEPIWERYVAALGEWRDGAVPLRFTSSPSRWSKLAADRVRWLPIPRTSLVVAATA